MTNREKFKEVFGFTPKNDPCSVAPIEVCADVCASVLSHCRKCPFYDWWNKKYIESFEIREEFENEGNTKATDNSKDAKEKG